MRSDTTSFFAENADTTNICLYHITERSSAESILKDGLKPYIGKNSQLCMEKQPLICLTDRESILYWLLLLDLRDPVLLKVALSEQPEKLKYGFYSEYLVFKPIASNSIALADQSILHEDFSDAQRKLCNSYMRTLCYMCVQIVRMYARESLDADYFKQIASFLDIIDRLDFTCYTQPEWRDLISAFGADGEYTFCDKSVDKIRLWAKIIMFPEDKYSSVRLRLSQMIQTLFYGCLDLCTGGLTA